MDTESASEDQVCVITKLDEKNGMWDEVKEARRPSITS